MNRDERTRLWARDTRGLRVISGVVGVVAGGSSVILLWVGALEMGSFVACVPGALTLAFGFFAMWLGRVVATMAEIAWFSSSENAAADRSETSG